MMTTVKEDTSAMKKLFAAGLLLAAGVLTAGGTAHAGLNPGTGILQSSHDLSSATGKGALYNAGTFADPLLDGHHLPAPHRSTAEAAAANITYPLWNHDIDDRVLDPLPEHRPGRRSSGISTSSTRPRRFRAPGSA
jgi:hypothetical protein